MSTTQITTTIDDLPVELAALARRLQALHPQLVPPLGFTVAVSAKAGRSVATVEVWWPNDVDLPIGGPDPLAVELSAAQQRAAVAEDALLIAEREHEAEVDALQLRVNDLTAKLADAESQRAALLRIDPPAPE